MKKVVVLFILTIQISFAQDFADSWVGHFSYNEVIDIVAGDNEVIVASQNALYRYNLLSNEITTFSTVNGLSGRDITQIYYSLDKDIIVVGFDNGLLQLIMDDGTVNTIVAITDKPSIPVNRKRINDFKERGDLLYIATDFGIALFNLARVEFDDTYFIGDNAAILRVKAIAIDGNNLFAASTENGGIRVADITDPFLIDFANWSEINSGSFDLLNNFNGDIYAASDQFQYRYNGVNFVFQGAQRADLKDYFSNDVLRSSTFLNDISVYDDTGTEVFFARDIEGITYSLTASLIIGSDLYIGTQQNGLIVLDINGLAPPQYVTAAGPSRNSVFSVTANAGDVWIGYGGHNIFYAPNGSGLFGVSRFKDDIWENYDSAAIQGISNIASITINPSVTDQVYLNSMGNGILEFEPDGNSTLFNQNNSTLRGVGSGATFEPNNIRVSESAFDAQGNLWSLNLIREQPLVRKTPAGQWSSIDFTNFFPRIGETGGYGSIEISSSNQLYFGSVDFGIFGYDITNNTFANITDGLQQGGLINEYVSALRLDQRGSLWIGSNLGLRVLFSPSSMFTDNPQDARSIVVEDQNGIPRELLDDEAVLDIEVDGNNNKWIATGSAGALLVSPSGGETIFQFTTDNSPLPDNEVRDITIDDTTGIVYFATKNGLVAFKGDRASKPRENLENVFAFPNPVRPGFNGNVTIDGLTERARVKITDIEGNLVYEKVSNGGTILWDTTSFSGNKVASGVYMLFISTSDNIETTISKIMIIR